MAIGIFVKRDGGPAPARVWYADLWGPREGKYKALAALDLPGTPWQELTPAPPFYLFVPQLEDRRAEYERGWPVNEIFPVNSVGMVTARDHLTIRWTPDEVWRTVQDFVSLKEEEAREKYHLGKDVRDWKVKLAQDDVKKSGPDRRKVIPILYRPFDVRFTYYTGQSRGFLCMPRPEVMRHFIEGRNFFIIFTRSISAGKNFEHVFCAPYGMLGRFYPDSSCITYFAPLYLHWHIKEKGKQIAFMTGQEIGLNLHSKFLEDCSGRLGLTFTPEGRGDFTATFGPEDVFYYAYAVFHSPTYRSRYAEFLRVDFPRLPLTANKDLFAALVKLGAELAALHLMESPALERLITRFPVSGSNVVDKVRYDEARRRVYINSDQYFEGVPPEVWMFQVGGYQVCHKWLKDRKGRTLSFADLTHYQKIVVALAETRRLMAEIDAAIEAHGGWPLT